MIIRYRNQQYSIIKMAQNKIAYCRERLYTHTAD